MTITLENNGSGDVFLEHKNFIEGQTMKPINDQDARGIINNWDRNDSEEQNFIAKFLYLVEDENTARSVLNTLTQKYLHASADERSAIYSAMATLGARTEKSISKESSQFLTDSIKSESDNEAKKSLLKAIYQKTIFIINTPKDPDRFDEELRQKMIAMNLERCNVIKGNNSTEVKELAMHKIGGLTFVPELKEPIDRSLTQVVYERGDLAEVAFDEISKRGNHLKDKVIIDYVVDKYFSIDFNLLTKEKKLKLAKQIRCFSVNMSILSTEEYNNQDIKMLDIKKRLLNDLDKDVRSQASHSLFPINDENNQ